MEVNNEENKLNYRPAGFWMRFWAYLSDTIIVFSINGFVLKFIDLMSGSQWMISQWSLGGLMSIAVFYIYFVLMTKYFNQTLGKMIFGLKVVSQEDTKHLTWIDILFREVVGRFIYKSFAILSLLYIVVAFNKEKQGIHDIFGETQVIHVQS